MADTNGKQERYQPLTPLAQRVPTEVRLAGSGNETDEGAIMAKYAWSAPLNAVAKMKDKLYGFMREASLSDVERRAVNSTNTLNDLLMEAPALNRRGRYEEEERLAKGWKAQMDAWQGPPATYKNTQGEQVSLDVEELLHQWSTADAWMLQLLVFEEKNGIDAAEQYYQECEGHEAAREDAEFKAASLRPPHRMYFWCRVRQLQINSERTYDLMMGYPILDVTEVKRKLADGVSAHDLIQELTWAFRASYAVAQSSLSDGEAYRELLMSMTAGQLPQQYPQIPPWGGYYPGGQPPQDGDDDQEPKDDRKAFFSFGGKQKQPEEHGRRSSRRPNRGRHRPRQRS